MSFQIRGLDPAPFRHLQALDDEALRSRGMRRMVADAHPGFPDRIELVDVPIGSVVLLMNHLHQPAANPYRASHAIFIRESATRAARFVDEVPEVMARRMISLRAYDTSDEMIDAALIDGRDLAAEIDRMLADGHAAYLHAHYAVRGCFAARIDRV